MKTGLQSTKHLKPYLVVAALGVTVVSAAQAEPRLPAQVFANDGAQAPLLSSTDNHAARFRAVGQLKAASSCTATLISASSSPPADALALIVTAGHCVNYFNQNEVWVDHLAQPGWYFTPAFFHDTQDQHSSYGIKRIHYATMKAVDLAVLELDVTYGALKADGIEPLRLREFEKAVRPIELLQVPVMGVEPYAQFLRHAECTTEPRQALYEAFFPWFWPRAVGNNCAGVAGGSSGGPVVERKQNTIIGVLNTTLDRSFNGCGMARPCEIDANQQPYAREGTSYFTSVESLIPALKSDGSFDASTLDFEQQVLFERPFTHVWTTRSQVPDAHGTLRPARWDLRLDGPFEQVRYKLGAAQSTDCAQMSGYGEALPMALQPLSELPTPTAEGVYIACVIGKPTGKPWQQNASFALREIDDTPPTAKPALARRDEAGDSVWRVMASAAPNELSSVMYKYGPQGTVDCRATQGYRPQLNNQYHVLDKRDAWTFCAYGLDLAENPGPVLEEAFSTGPRSPAL